MRKLGAATIVLFSGCVAFSDAGRAEAERLSGEKRLAIEAFIVSGQPLTAKQIADACCDVRIYNLDAMNDLSQSLGRSLPRDPALAESVAREILDVRRADVRSAVKAHAEALSKALHYGLDRYPALVLNEGEFVIYGVTDLEAALAIYHREASQ